MAVRRAATAAWVAGAALGLFAGLLMVSWLPLLLKAVLIGAAALVVDLPRTRSSRGLQAGFLTCAGAVAFFALMLTDVLSGPLTALSVLAIGIGLWRTLEFVDRRRWA